jgi:hypothetical protein
MTVQTIATIVLCVVYIPVVFLIYFVAIRFNEVNHRFKIIEKAFDDLKDEWQKDDDDLEDECTICKHNIDNCECEYY